MPVVSRNQSGAATILPKSHRSPQTQKSTPLPLRWWVGSSWRVVVESSSRRVFRRQYQEGYGWEAAALCDSSQLIGRVLVPGFP